MCRRMSAKLDGLSDDRYLDTNETLLVIRSQLHSLTKSMESCQSEVGTRWTGRHIAVSVGAQPDCLLTF